MTDTSTTAAVTVSGSTELLERIAELEARLATITPISRSSKIALRLKEPDTFFGKTSENVDRWLFQVEQYLRAADEDADSHRVAFAAALLRGTAAAWWENVCKENAADGKDESECTWIQFKENLTKCFRSVNREERARDQLAKLEQKTSVADYISRFTAIAFDISDLNHAEKYDRFFRGLKPNIRQQLVLKGKPATFDALMAEAERVDAVLFETSGRKFSGRSSFQFRNEAPQPMELGVINSHATPRIAENTKLND